MPFCLTLHLRTFSACRRHSVPKVRDINIPTPQQQMRVGLSVQISRCLPCSGVSSLSGSPALPVPMPLVTPCSLLHMLLTFLPAGSFFFFLVLIQNYPLFKIILVTSQQEMITPHLGFPGGSGVKNLPAKAGDVGLIPGSGRSPREGNDKPLQYSCLGNPMDRGTWFDTVHGVGKNQTYLSN